MEIILFFALGILAALIKSDLEIPEQLSKSLSIFLLLSIGLKGGHELSSADNLSGFLPVVLIGLAFCVVIPIVFFFLFKNKLGDNNAGALSACYGSVSAVTFITAQSVLDSRNIPHSGFMVATMALMEIPAILIGIYFYQKFSQTKKIVSRIQLFRSVITSKSVVLLVGGFFIGFMMDPASWQGFSPLIVGCFKGVLCFFLLDLGMIAQRQLKDILKYKVSILVIALIMPIIFGSIALLLSHVFGLSLGNQVLISILVGSASYIAAPAAIKSSIPTANPSLFLGLPLALTFPLNLLVGISYYVYASQWLSS